MFQNLLCYLIVREIGVPQFHQFIARLADVFAVDDIAFEGSGPQAELDRLTRQFWVAKAQVVANKYDLSASRYRQVDADAAYHEKPSVTLDRLARLEQVMMDEIRKLGKLVKGE